MSGVNLFISSTTFLEVPAVFRAYYMMMPKYRQAKIDRCYFSNDKRKSLLAGILLKYALKEYAAHSGDEIILTEHGKPYLKSNPEIFFNLSHSGKMVLLALGDSEVGCDIEEMLDFDWISTAKSCFCEQEYAYIMSSTERNLQNFYRIWTLKESFLKMTGYGLNISLNSVEFCFDGANIQSIQHFGDMNYFLKTFTIGNYCCACCSVTQNLPDKLTYISDNVLKGAL